MSNKKNNIYPPLALLKQIAAAYPKAWAQMEMFHNEKGKQGLPSWPDWCYAPMSAALAVTMGSVPDTFDNRIVSVHDAQIVMAIAPWRLSKEVFVMDEEMQELLFEQADDLKLNPELLLHLPYTCFYIQFASGTVFHDVAYHGVFVHLEYDSDREERELRLLYLTESGETIGVPIHIDVETIEDSIRIVGEEAYHNLPKDKYEYRRVLIEETESRQQTALFYKQTLQLVLYLCAQNAEITPNSEQTFYTRRSPVIKDRYAEIRKWNVGVRIGNAVRAYRKAAMVHETRGGAHASPRPHIRRGHWHHFWTGSKSDPDTRKLVLKWVAPTFVSVSAEEAPVTLHPVIEKKE